MEGEERGYWRWRKRDFFPEESFQSFGSYRAALSHQTCSRFKNRLVSRSHDENERFELKIQSEHEMKRCLTWWDLVWFGFGSVIGAGIFVLTGQEAHEQAGPAIVLSYVVSGVSAMLSVFCTEFAVEIPVAGGSFAYLRIELGDFAAFITARNILLEGIVGTAAVARAWTSYFATPLNRNPNALRIKTDLSPGYNLLDPIAVVVIVVSATVESISTRKTSLLNWIASAINTLVIFFVIIAGFIHANTSNLTPFFPYGPEGVFRAAAVVYFAYGGFDSIATMAEETKNPSKDIPIGLLGSMSIIMVIYCLMALSLSMMQKYTDTDPNAAYSVAFQSVGMKWGKYLVALGALKGMTTVLLVGALGQARYVTHIARTHMIPPVFALVHPKTGTPINANLLVAIPNALIAFFSGLDVLASLLSISTLFIFTMMPIALLVRRYYVREVTPRADLHKLTICLLFVVASSMGTSAYWGMQVKGSWIGYTISVPFWFLGTLGIVFFVPQPESVGRTVSPVAPMLINRNKHLPHGIFRSYGFCKVWGLHFSHVAILFLAWSSCNIRYGSSANRTKILETRKIVKKKCNLSKGLFLPL